MRSQKFYFYILNVKKLNFHDFQIAKIGFFPQVTKMISLMRLNCAFLPTVWHGGGGELAMGEDEMKKNAAIQNSDAHFQILLVAM